jgi:hypothetical protein
MRWCREVGWLFVYPSNALPGATGMPPALFSRRKIA